MHRERLSGVFAPITTPFGEDGSILLEKMRSNIGKLNKSRLRGYLVLGTNGEFRGLSQAEQMEILKAVVQAASCEVLEVRTGDVGIQVRRLDDQHIDGVVADAYRFVRQLRTVLRHEVCDYVVLIGIEVCLIAQMIRCRLRRSRAPADRDQAYRKRDA